MTMPVHFLGITPITSYCVQTKDPVAPQTQAITDRPLPVPKADLGPPARFCGPERLELANLKIQAIVQDSLRTQKADLRLPTTRVWSYLEDTNQTLVDFFRTSSGLFVTKTEQGLQLVTTRGLVLGGAIPIQETKPLPAPYSGSLYALLDEIIDTVHETVSGFDYSGLSPFVYTIEQISSGKDFSEVKFDSEEFENGSICVGMSVAILKALKKSHNVDGMLAIERPVGDESFTHAAVIVECSDGYVFLDARPDPENRIFVVPFNRTAKFPNFSLTALGPRSKTPLILTQDDKDFEYVVDRTNGAELVSKFYMMVAPLQPSFDCAFPIVRYREIGRTSQIIWISPLNQTIVFKDMNVPADHPHRSMEVSFQDIENGALDEVLPILYSRPRNKTFHIPLDTLKKQIYTFVVNRHQIDKLLYEAPPVPGSI